MNAEQKQRALAALGMWHSSNDDSLREYQAAELMAALLQERVDAPTQKPFGYFKAEPFGWTDCAETDDGAIALFAAPPAPSVPDVELQAAFDRGLKAGNEQKDAQQVEIHRLHGLLAGAPPAPSVPDGWRPFLSDVVTAAGLLEHGKRDKGLAGRIGKFAFDAMRAAPTPAEAPADVARDAARYRWLRTHGLQRAWVSLGTDFEGDNFASFRCEFNLPEPPNLPYEDDEGLQWADKDFDAAIDAAIEREILGGGE